MPERDSRGRFVRADPLIEAEETGLGLIALYGLGAVAVIAVVLVALLVLR